MGMSMRWVDFPSRYICESHPAELKENEDCLGEIPALPELPSNANYSPVVRTLNLGLRVFCIFAVVVSEGEMQRRPALR